MKKYLFLFVLLLVVFTMTHAWANDFEWYTVKDEISGGINFRSEPILDSEVLVCMILDNFVYVIPLFRVVEKRMDGWYKVQSNRNGVDINVNYEYKYFWVAGWLLRKVNPEKEKLGILVPADYEYSIGVNVHKEPHVFSCSEGGVPNRWKYVYVAVKMTGKRIGPFIEIIQLCCFGKGSKGFVLGEYFGFKEGSKYLKFSVPKTFYTRTIYLDGGYYSGSFTARAGPSILSRKVYNYASGGMQVEVVGEQGHFYKTSKNKWIFKQCLIGPKK